MRARFRDFWEVREQQDERASSCVRSVQNRARNCGPSGSLDQPPPEIADGPGASNGTILVEAARRAPASTLGITSRSEVRGAFFLQPTDERRYMGATDMTLNIATSNLIIVN